MEKTMEYTYRATFRAKDPMSALTHFIGFLLAIFGTFPLLLKASSFGHGFADILSLCVFMFCMIALYGASSAYHTFDLSKNGNLWLKRLDHMMIYLLIAGSYTPVCIIGIKGAVALRLLTAVWAVAALGMVLTIFWVCCPKWVSSALYIALGWAAVAAMPQIIAAFSFAEMFWLVLGGVLYTIGGVIYALKLKPFNKKHPNFGSHEIFHTFVLLGTLCHYILIYAYLI